MVTMYLDDNLFCSEKAYVDRCDIITDEQSDTNIMLPDGTISDDPRLIF